MILAAGIGPALAAAFLFGSSTPLARALVGSIDPAWLAGCLYAGSGLGLSALRCATSADARKAWRP
jgi:hypothetical protein